METIKERINLLYCKQSNLYYDIFCRILDVISDSEADILFDYFDEYDSDEYIITTVSDIDTIAEILGVDVENIENRL